MTRTLTLSATLLALAAVGGGCTPRHFRYVDRTGEQWTREVAEYPRVVRTTEQKFAPVAPEKVAVYYRVWGSGDPRKFAMDASETAPPEGLLVLADLAVFRGPLPRREEALSELRRLAGDLGAQALTEVYYTAVMGEKYVGGTELVGWIYKARAAHRNEEEL